MYVCASTRHQGPLKNPSMTRFCVPKNTSFLFLVLCFYHLSLPIPTLLTIVGYQSHCVRQRRSTPVCCRNNQLVDHLEAAANENNKISDDLFKFRALFGHQGPLKPTDQNWKGSKFNVLVDWETGEKIYEPLSVLAADDPVTCATYAKENDLYTLMAGKDSETWQKGTRP